MRIVLVAHACVGPNRQGRKTSRQHDLEDPRCRFRAHTDPRDRASFARTKSRADETRARVPFKTRSRGRASSNVIHDSRKINRHCPDFVGGLRLDACPQSRRICGRTRRATALAEGCHGRHQENGESLWHWCGHPSASAVPTGIGLVSHEEGLRTGAPQAFTALLPPRGRKYRVQRAAHARTAARSAAWSVRPSALARFSRSSHTSAGKRTDRGMVGPVS